MKSYEMLYVLDSASTDEAKEAFAKRLEGVITASGGEVKSVDKWGVKKLAYPINYKTDGEYYVLNFVSDGAAVKELDRIAGLTAEVLRRVITVKE